jgi:hypothetical protein
MSRRSTRGRHRLYGANMAANGPSLPPLLASTIPPIPLVQNVVRQPSEAYNDMLERMQVAQNDAESLGYGIGSTGAIDELLEELDNYIHDDPYDDDGEDGEDEASSIASSARRRRKRYDYSQRHTHGVIRQQDREKGKQKALTDNSEGYRYFLSQFAWKLGPQVLDIVITYEKYHKVQKKTVRNILRYETGTSQPFQLVADMLIQIAKTRTNFDYDRFKSNPNYVPIV